MDNSLSGASLDMRRVACLSCRWLLVGIVTSTVPALPAARGEIILHNGSSAPPSNPLGTDEVPVVFVADAEPDTGILVVAAAFFANTTHTFEYRYESPEPPVLFVDFAIVNDTAVPWSGYDIALFGGDFFGLVDPAGPNLPFTPGDLAPTTDPVAEVAPLPENLRFESAGATVAGSSIVRDGEDAELSIAFDEFVDPGELFFLTFFIDDVGAMDDGFVMSQTPTPIPAPGAAVLGLLGCGVVGSLRRRLR